jgi:chromate reductase, NAD(P)H dehydrogenase (quinone)
LRVVGISGSLRPSSYNTALLKAAATELPAEATFVPWRGLGLLPAYREDCDGPRIPPAVASLRRTLSGADAVLIATPEYNGSIPGSLKNALDWASRPFPDNCLRRKPVAVIGASTGLFGAIWAQAELRRILKKIGADVLEAELPVPAAHAAFTPDARLRERELANALREIVHQLVSKTERAAA